MKRRSCPATGAVIQSFRQSKKALVRGMAPDGRAPGHPTLHRRFQGFATQLDPVPADPPPGPLTQRLSAGRRDQAQAPGGRAQRRPRRAPIGHRQPHAGWAAGGPGLQRRGPLGGDRGAPPPALPRAPKVLVSDGEEGIPRALAGPETLPQRCLVHARRGSALCPVPGRG